MVISMIFYYLCCNSSIDIFDSMPRKLVIMLLMMFLRAHNSNGGCATMTISVRSNRRSEFSEIHVPTFRENIW